MSSTAVQQSSVFVARQPIFDRTKEIFGYELLFRSGLENLCRTNDQDGSTLDVISNSILVIGLEELTDGKRGFINFTRKLLTEDVASLLPKEVLTIEILEDVDPDEEVMSACRKLKEDGHVLAMDDFVTDHLDSPLIDLADIIKVDFMGTDVETRRRICRQLSGRDIRMLAEKVETPEEFDQAVEWGYDYFQGYFFSKPVIKTGRSISGSGLTYLRVLNEVNKPGISYDDLEQLVKQDISLTYKLLRFMNSIWFGFKAEIRSIKHALVLLGPKEIKKWFALVALRHTATDKPSELIRRAMVCAKACEGCAPLVGLKNRASDLFLLGMFSFIDALTDTAMPEIVAKLPLAEDIRAALLGKPSRLKGVHDAVLSYEQGCWDDFAEHAAAAKLEEHRMAEVFTDSLKWANQALSAL